MLESYRQARLAAMKAARSAAKFGSMTHLSRADFVREVTDASKDAWVIVLLYKDSIDASRMLEEAMVHAAEKFRAVRVPPLRAPAMRAPLNHAGCRMLPTTTPPQVKFMKIVADQCIENYPDSNVPSVLVYHDGEMVTTQVGINGPFGGAPVRTIDIEYWLYELGAIETELEDDPRVAKRERARVHRAEGSARAAFGDDFE